VAVLVEDALEFDFRRGLFYIRYPDGTERAMRPNTYFATVAAAAKMGKRFKFGGAEIVPFCKDAGGH
jgi:hypothetical protein